MGKTIDKELHKNVKEHLDLSMCVCKIRVNFETDEHKLAWLEVISDFLSEIKVKFKRYSCAEHHKCETPHFHYHLILDQNIKNIPRELKNPAYHFRDKYLVKKGLKDFPTYSIVVQPLYTSDVQPSFDTAISRILRYPFKEGSAIMDYCSDSPETIEGMINTASEEYRFAQERKLKTKIEQEIKITKWNELRDYLDSRLDGANSAPELIWQQIALYMRNDSVPPTIKAINTNVERYILLRADDEKLYKMAEKQTTAFRGKFQSF